MKPRVERSLLDCFILNALYGVQYSQLSLTSRTLAKSLVPGSRIIRTPSRRGSDC